MGLGEVFALDNLYTKLPSLLLERPVRQGKKSLYEIIGMINSEASEAASSGRFDKCCC